MTRKNLVNLEYIQGKFLILSVGANNFALTLLIINLIGVIRNYAKTINFCQYDWVSFTNFKVRKNMKKNMEHS
jgi:hypothetical protein